MQTPSPESLWPDKAFVSSEKETIVNRDVEQNEHGLNRSISNVNTPQIFPYLPTDERVTDIAVIVLPGGGFDHLAIDKEGHDVARWLNTIGIVGFVLKYRTVGADSQEVIATATTDVQRAIRLVRSRSQEWGIDPHKIGLIGFSAGGYLVASAAVSWDDGQAGASDPVERASSRPSFLGLIYPGVPEDVKAQITQDTPPAFLVHADDDWLNSENSLRFYRGLHRAKVPAELHIYAQGSHGFGLGVRGGPVASWTGLFESWLESR